MTGSSTVTNLTNNNSQIIFSSPFGDPTLLDSYKTLTVANYGGALGTIALNTYLGGDNSPSDRVVINGGRTTGATGLAIRNNTLARGAETLGNGIRWL